MTVKSDVISAFSVRLENEVRQRILWPSIIQLDPKYFESLQRHVVPLDAHHLRRSLIRLWRLMCRDVEPLCLEEWAMPEQEPEQQPSPGSRLGDSMMFGPIEHTEKIEEAMAETQPS